MKKVIGIVPASFIGDAEKSCMDDYYRLGNNYIKRVAEAGCIPFGLAPVDNFFTEDELALCDGFLVQGGAEFYPYHFQVIHHAVTHGKRYLGICLGDQLIYVYFKLKEILEERGYEGELVSAMLKYLGEQPKGFSLQKRVDGHKKEHPKRGCEDEAKHGVNIVEGTILHRLLGRDTMRICTSHYLATPPEQTLVKVNAWSALGDGVVEGVEYSDHILGVQGHPEVDGLLSGIFKFLAEN